MKSILQQFFRAIARSGGGLITKHYEKLALKSVKVDGTCFVDLPISETYVDIQSL